MASISFGTDGWRAVIAEDFTFENLDRVAQATADYWLAHPIEGTERRVVIGYDRRFLSNEFAHRVAEVMAGNGFEVILGKEAVPTPSVSHAVRNRKAIGGVMLTASHNSPRFNGFKIKAHYGGSAEPALCKGVEALLDQQVPKSLPLADAIRSRQVRLADLKAPHFKDLKKLVDFPSIAASGAKFAHEALFGVGAGCFDELLAGTTCQVTTLNAAHDPNFGGINPEPIPANYTASAAYLAHHPHDICLVTDGDADRVGAMDGRGGPLSTHQVICLLLQHYLKNRKARGRVIKALTTTSMVDKMCLDYGLELVETGVGFKYICSEMIRGDVLLGFEESGGIGFPGHVPERDGILAGLMLLEMMAVEKGSITSMIKKLERKYGPHRYARIDTHFPLDKRPDLMAYCKDHPPAKLLGSPVVEVKSFDGVKYIAADGAWLMLRGSGTEPILRIYAEASTDEGAAKLLKVGVGLTKKV